MKRRIALRQIHTISISAIVNEVVLHIPNEYDYLYRVANKKDVEQIVRTLQESAQSLSHHIKIWIFELNSLAQISDNDKSHTKRNETQEQYMQRKVAQWQSKYTMKRYELKQQQQQQQKTKPKHNKSQSAMIHNNINNNNNNNNSNYNKYRNNSPNT